jgi:hypothetical protein
MMEPSKYPVDDDDRRWSEMLESLRKDIECVNGEVKQEFAILKYGPRFSDLDLVDSIFKTCMAMHNQRKRMYGLDEPWQGDLVEECADLHQGAVPIQRRLNQQARDAVAEDAMGMGPGEWVVRRGDGEHDEVEDLPERQAHDAHKKRLIIHFNQALKKGEVYWPKRSGDVRLYVPSVE